MNRNPVHSKTRFEVRDDAYASLATRLAVLQTSQYPVAAHGTEHDAAGGCDSRGNGHANHTFRGHLASSWSSDGHPAVRAYRERRTRALGLESLLCEIRDAHEDSRYADESQVGNANHMTSICGTVEAWERMHL